jgi:hypothetical protein
LRGGEPERTKFEESRDKDMQDDSVGQIEVQRPREKTDDARNELTTAVQRGRTKGCSHGQRTDKETVEGG